MSEWWMEDFTKTYEGYPESDRQEALAAGERLLSRPDFPHQEGLRKNLTWFLDPLPGSKTHISIDVPEGWSCFNPSIAADPDGNLRAIIRTANYVMSPEGRYGGAYDTEEVIRTINWTGDVIWDKFCDIYELESIEDDHLRPETPLFPVHGFEDCRLFWSRKHGWQFSATVRERNARGVCQQVQCDLADFRAENFVELSPAHDTHEKNWMPYQYGGYISHCYPTIMTGHLTWSPAPYITHAFRGGSQVIRLPDASRLAVIHESVDFPDQIPHRVYWHRFVRFKGGAIQRISYPFCFQRRGVEFCAGMALQGEDLILSYGVHDQEAWLHRMPLKTALGMLKDVEEER